MLTRRSRSSTRLLLFFEYPLVYSIITVVFVITWATRDACTWFGNEHVNSK